MYIVEKIDTYQGFKQLASSWNSLLESSQDDNIFFTHAWLDSWWTAFGDAYDMYTLIVKSGEDILGIAPLMRTRQRTIQFIGTPNADYCSVIGIDKGTIIAQIYNYLTDNSEDWRRIDLQHIPDKTAAIDGFRAAVPNGKFPYSLKEMENCVAYKYDGQEEERPDFSLRRNKTMRNNIKYFNRNGGLSLVRMQNEDEIAKHLPAFFHGHIVRWEKTPTPSKFMNEKHRNFYQNLVKNLAPHKQISLMSLLNEDKPLAYFFTYDYKKVLYLYTPIFDLFFSKRSPGLILINMMTDFFIQNGYSLIDHTRGAEGYKRHFTNITTTNYRLIIYSRKADYRSAAVTNGMKRGIPLLPINKRLMTFKGNITNYLHTHGMASLMKALAKRFIRFLYHYQVMVVWEHAGAPARDFPVPPEVTIEQLVEDDLPIIATFLGIERGSRKHQVVMRRFSNGGECFIIRYNGNIAAIGWGMFKEDFLTDIGKRFPLQENDVDLGDDYTSPVFRGLGLHPILIAYRVRRYMKKNHRLLCTILSDNIASIKGYRKNDFVPISKIRYLRILGIRIL